MLAASRAVSTVWSSFRPAPRAILLAMVLLLAMLALAACGQQPPPPPATSSSSEPQPEPQPAPTPTPTTSQPAQPAPIVTGDARLRVGLLLPLTGQHAALGQSMLHAAEMALFDAGNDNIALIVKDTEAGGAGAAAQAALTEGAQLILGPLFAAQVSQVAPVARGRNVPVVSFSTDRSVAGSNVYVMGIMPELQIRRVVAFATARGYPRIAALLPNSAYGRTVAQALNSAMVGTTGNVALVEFYDTSSTDMAPYVRRLASARASYDALLIPESGDRLRLIAPLLPFYDIHASDVRMLGSTLWDDVRLGAEAGIAGAWFAAPPAENWTRFEQRYRQLYGNAPARLASLAYDGTALAAALARDVGPEQIAAGAIYDQAALTRNDGFAGIDGIFRFAPDGTVDRGLAVMELQYNRILTVDPAPTSFQDAIY